MTERPRAVVDTNLVVSALVFASEKTFELRTGWQAGRFDHCWRQMADQLP